MSAKWLHCNKCYVRWINSNKQFYLAHCSHILCSKCGQHSAMNKACIVCKMTVSLIPLDKKMPTHVNNYFQSIDSLYASAKKTIDYQMENRVRLIKGLSNRYDEIRKEYKRLLDAFRAVKADCIRVQEFISSLQKQNAAFDSYREGSRYTDASRGPFSDYSMNSSNTIPRPHNLYRNIDQASFSSLISGPRGNDSSGYLSQLFLNGKHN